MAPLLQRLYGAPYLLLTLTALFWGGNAVAGQLAKGEISPFILTFSRWAIVIALMLPLQHQAIKRQWPLIKPRLGLLLFYGALGFTAFNTLFYVASHHTSAINIGIIQGSVPAFVFIGAFLAYRTNVTLAQVIGVVITLVGVLLIATKADYAILQSLRFNIGDMQLLLACLLYAGYTVLLRKRPALDGLTFFTLIATSAAITTAPFAAYEMLADTAIWPATPKAWLLIGFISFFPSCLGQIFYLRGVDLIGPGRAGIFVNLVPVFAALLAIAILGEEFAPYHAVALALVLGGIMITQHRQQKAAGQQAK